MNFLKKFFSGNNQQTSQRYYQFAVQCDRCGEVVHGRVDMNNDLSVDYEQSSPVFRVRKLLVGENRCFQRMEVELKFTEGRQLLEKYVSGGKFLP